MNPILSAISTGAIIGGPAEVCKVQLLTLQNVVLPALGLTEKPDAILHHTE